MDKNNIINEYFEWMTNIVCGKRFSGKMTYKKLLSCLHMITFRCEMRSDENRAEDGVDLRWRFAVDTGRENQNDWIRDCLEGPCSVLEMMVLWPLGSRRPSWTIRHSAIEPGNGFGE